MFSPVCHCSTNDGGGSASGCGTRDPVTVTIVDSDGHEVATVAYGRHEPRRHVQFRGTAARTTARLAPDGVYRPRSTSRTGATRSAAEPDRARHDGAEGALGERREGVLFAGAGRSVAIRYALSEPAHAVVYLGRGRSSRPSDQDAQPGSSGRARSTAVRFPPATTTFSRSPRATTPETRPRARPASTSPSSFATSTSRHCGSRCGRGKRLTVRVETDASRYKWRLAGSAACGAGGAASARPDDARDVPPRGDRAWTLGDRARPGEAEVIGLSEIAGPIACIGLAVLLVARTRRNRIAGLCYAGVGTVLLVASFSPASVPELLAAIGGAIVLGPLLAWLFKREPWLIAYGTLAFIPFRVHFAAPPAPCAALRRRGRRRLAAAVGARRRRRTRSRSSASPRGRSRSTSCWIGLSLEWSVDVHTRRSTCSPSTSRSRFSRSRSRACRGSKSRVRLLYVELVAMALVFVAVGFYQYETRNIFQNPKLQIDQHLRGGLPRQLRLLRPLDLRALPRDRAVADAPCSSCAGVWGGSGRRAGLRGRDLARPSHLVLAVELLGAARRGLLASPRSSGAGSRSSLSVPCSSSSAVSWRPSRGSCMRSAITRPAGLNDATHGRASLVANGIRIAKAHPALGVGLGGFEHAYSKRTHRTARKSASHNTPVTVAAEEGAVGLALSTSGSSARCSSPRSGGSTTRSTGGSPSRQGSRSWRSSSTRSRTTTSSRIRRRGGSSA